jgi:hypothetical protein
MREHPRVGGGVPIRVVVVGPPQSGKTSFITAAATESFPEHVPPALPPTLLSAHSLPDRAPCLLVDTSSRAEDRAQLAQQLRSAHVVLLCYAADAAAQATLQALRTEWLPELRRAASSRPGWPLPVVLLGCKLDAVAAGGQTPGSSAACLASELAGEAPTGCVDASLECSSRTLVAVHAAVYAACAAVLHPVAPLFDARQQALQPDALAALRRIFVLCDADGDAALSERELSAFQAACYGVPLAPGEVADVLRTVGERLPQGVTPRGGLSLVGFLYTQALLLQHGRCDAVWAALRAFGYGPQLTLQLDALPPGAQALRGRGGGEHPSLELTPQGTSFLGAAFSRACGGATHMWWPQLEALFATSPGGAAGAVEALGWTHTWRWPDAVQPPPTGAGLTCAAFTALWALSGATHPGAVVQQLCYLCFPGDPAGAVRLPGRSQGAHPGGVTARLWRPRHAQQAGVPPGQTPGGLLSRGRRTAVMAVIGPSGDDVEDDTVASLLDALHARWSRDAGVSCGDISTPVPTSHGAGGARAGLGAAHAVPSPPLGAAPYASTPVRTPPAQQAMGGESGIGKQRVVVVAAPLESDPSAPAVPGTPVGGVSHSQGGGGGGGREEEVPFVTVLLTPPHGWMSSQQALRPWHGSARPDLLLFPFDARSRTSFGAAARRLNEWATATAARGPHLPALLLATHPAEEQPGGDARLIWDDGLVEAFTASLGIPQPEELWSGQPGQVDSALARLAQAALCQEPVVPESRAARARRVRLRSLRRGAAAAVGSAALLGGGLYLYKAYRRSSASN